LLASLARYEVVRVLGGGGMGVVVLARNSEKGGDVAIKLIKPELVSDQRMVHRFVKEAGHLQKLKHPNVVPVLEVSDRPEGPYFVMPYFEQGSLAHRIRPGQPLEPEVILETAGQVANGLGFAHRHGIIHRDLKPANILLGNDGKSCLADFGLARTMFNDTIVDVEREELEGTAPYMSPGVAAGHAEDTRCDIYAFGALLYEMLTGEPPYIGSNTNEIRRQILAGQPIPISTRNPGADAGLVAVAEGAMARELRDRYADMADVLADLERIKAGKAPVGPHGISGRVKQLPFSLWIPGGLILIAFGLWMLWSSAPDKGPATTLPVTNTHVIVPASHVVEPPHVQVPSTVQEPVPAVVPQGEWHVSIFAGQPGTRGNTDGTAADARFQSPGGIAIDMSQSLYLADTGNNTVRKITRDGTVSTLAGMAGQPGDLDGRGNAARFMAPLGIAADQKGNVYVAEFASDIIRKITPEGIVGTLAGSAGNPGSKDGVGDNAHFRNPWSVAANNIFGNLFIADRSNFTIRRITPAGLVSTFAGHARTPGYADGPGSYARFGDPCGVAVSLIGNVYVADAANCVIRKIDGSGMVSTLAGMANSRGNADGVGNKARFSNLQSVVAVNNGNIYVLDGDVIRLITAEGAVTTLPTLNDGSGHFIHPSSMVADPSGALYLVEATHDVIWEATPLSLFNARHP